MRITIRLSREEVSHIKEHIFYDCCGIVEDIMRKVQRECNKKI